MSEIEILECPREDCRIRRFGSEVHPSRDEPLYDKRGRLIPDEGFWQSWTEECLVCRKQWALHEDANGKITRLQLAASGSGDPQP